MTQGSLQLSLYDLASRHRRLSLQTIWIATAFVAYLFAISGLITYLMTSGDLWDSDWGEPVFDVLFFVWLAFGYVANLFLLWNAYRFNDLLSESRFWTRAVAITMLLIQLIFPIIVILYVVRALRSARNILSAAGIEMGPLTLSRSELERIRDMKNVEIREADPFESELDQGRHEVVRSDEP